MFRRSSLIVIIIVSMFCAQSSFSDIIINEIHFDPDDKTEWVEFIELYNSGDSDVDLTGWSVENAVDYQFNEGASISAGGYLLVGQDSADLWAKYRISRSRIHAPFEGRLNNEGERVELRSSTGELVDSVDYQLGFPWPTVGEPESEFRRGTSHSIQLLNPSLDNDLAGSWRSEAATPLEQNTVFTDHVPPQIRQVKHTPKQPASGEQVVISVKVSDPDGVASVVLLYQQVNPGQYIALADAEYDTNWISIQMVDDGSGGDAIAGDFVFTVQMPASLQQHRSFVRYRIEFEDSLGNSVIVPYQDDPQPNFAYFVYDGVPDWTGAVRPGQSPELTYSGEMLSSVPVYHLISSRQEIEKCTWRDQYKGNDYPYMGTLVYDGIVYDHIPMRARGGVWRYSMGKNMWKFNMNRGRPFQARDNYGREYNTRWDKVNLGANIQQGNYLHRGEQGMFESVGFKLFDMAGIEASNTNFVHLRIIDDEHEEGTLNPPFTPINDSGTQYDGDFWGLYLATEQVDGRFLDEHGLPDGNLYKMEGGSGEIRNQSPYGVSDASDMVTFLNDHRRFPNEEFWRETTDLKRYYNYRSMVEGIHQYDIANGKNYYYYLNPETDQWFQIPWDLDLTWANNMFGQGDDPFKQSGILNHDDINTEYQNRMRELRDLLYNPDQAGQLIDEFASFIYHPTKESFVDADRAMWDYHWVMGRDAANRGLNNPQKSGQGRFYNIADAKDFPGMVKRMKDYVVSRGRWIDNVVLSGDRGVPDTPAIRPVNDHFRLDSLTFETSEFSDDETGSTFSAMKWRVAEVEPFAVPWSVDDDGSGLGDGSVILIDAQQSWRYFKGTREPSQPTRLWRRLEFNDIRFLTGQAPIGYGEAFIKTNLSDMRYNYTTFYLRKTFRIEDLNAIGSLAAAAVFDDGFNMWINGVHVAQEHVSEEELPFDALADHRENTEYVDIELKEGKDYLVEGENIIAVQVINQFIDRSSDCFFDMTLVGVLKEQPSTEPEPNPNSGTQPEPKTVLHGLTEPLKYEIDAVWESEERSDFQSQITLPADQLVAGRTYRVRVKMKDNDGAWSHWSNPIQFVAEETGSNGLAKENLQISEMMYNPPGGSQFEFIELYNSQGSVSLSVDGFTFTDGVSYTFPTGYELEPNSYVLITPSANEAERAAFRQYYGLDGSVKILGPYTGKLSNGGERLTLQPSLAGEEIINVEYSDGRGWPVSTDGAGHSLVLSPFLLNSYSNDLLDYGGNWQPSALIGGSPGESDSHHIDMHVVINEIAAITEDGSDWIEIYNPTTNTFNLSSVYLSDDDAVLTKWALPSVDVAPGETVVFDAQSGFNQNGEGFGVNRNGESLYLSYLPDQPGVDRVLDSVSFKAQERGQTWGRVNDGDYWAAMAPSPGAKNLEVSLSVFIDEFMFHPLGVNGYEYIELYNQTDGDVSLFNENGPWRIDGGVDFILPANTVLPASGRLLIVPFIPENEAEVNAFKTQYQLAGANLNIAGPYTGSLSNRGERIALEKLVDVDPFDGSLAWAIIDEVVYYDRMPWPDGADGTGGSLQRVSTLHSGNDPLNWKPGSPNPGSESTIETSVFEWMMY